MLVAVVAGSVQDDEFGVFNPGQQTFSLTMTLDVVNGQVIARDTYFYPCGESASRGSGGMYPAAIAADGSFTLQPPQVVGLPAPTVALTVSGTVPQTSGIGWSGTYAATNANPGCSPVTGSFTATPIQPVTGTFGGTASLGAPNSALAAAPVLSIAFQQGGPSSLDNPGPGEHSLVNSVDALSGTIDVTGFPCFTRGTASIPSGSVAGSFIETQFTMNDGSTLQLQGSVGDTSTSSIVLSSLSVRGGGCNGWFGSRGVVLARQ